MGIQAEIALATSRSPPHPSLSDSNPPNSRRGLSSRRLVPKSAHRYDAPPSAPTKTSALNKTIDELNDIHKAVDKLTCSLRERRPQRGPAQDQRQAIDLILKHLDVHGGNLWGHVVKMPDGLGGGVRAAKSSPMISRTCRPQQRSHETSATQTTSC